MPFNKPYLTGNESKYITQSLLSLKLSGDGSFTDKCHEWLEEQTKTNKALLTHSCTAALEMAAILLDVKEDDEIIMPSYTFVSTANAFVLRGGVPIFVDVRSDTLNIDENLIESAITSKTKAIVVVHYAGVACEMDFIMTLARKYNIRVIEDAAQGVLSSYKGKALGSIGDLGCYSFHDTKNIISGEGGCLLVNDPLLIAKAEMIREKGTDRSQFIRGEVDKYTWRNIGSSYLPSESIAAFLWAQLEHAQEIVKNRLTLWQNYHQLFEPLELLGIVQRPYVPDGCQHNGHIYYLNLDESISRSFVLEQLKKMGITCTFHYVPLHQSPAGTKYTKVCGSMAVTEKFGVRLIRLPLWVEMTEDMQEYIFQSIQSILTVKNVPFKEV
ncbi:dTDP-4-amino-4,6-dideoxygalactose transaminase [Pseudoalteromonas sp. C2R02]|nr:dTDP-4-amino-4,6-dideoxygalactose transaminase [Pseudoalteromonas sp. C2R02]